jgi:prephenate dehydrogenase
MDEPGFTPRSLAECRIAIVGLGLMGGSLALALRDHCREIIGVEADSNARAFARSHSFVNRLTDFDLALGASDFLILATPVCTILAQLASIHNSQFTIHNRQSSVIILDLGSTKSAIGSAMEKLPPPFDPLGGHPMCGKEIGGIENADPDLYRGKTFVLTPLPRTTPNALALAHELIAALGATPLLLDAGTHDRYAAAISHLPYALSVALMRVALATKDEAQWRMAASGFRDATRLAASDLTMMSDILLTNRTPILDSLKQFRAELDALAAAIESGDPDSLRAALESAQTKRSELFKP